MSETTHHNVTSGWQPYLPPDRRGLLPWPNGKVWFWSLMALVIVVLTTIAWGVPFIESRLDRLSRARLLSAGIDASTLNLRWDYRNLVVNGQLPANSNIEQLTRVLRQGMGDESALFATGIRRLEIDVDPAAEIDNSLLPPSEEAAVEETALSVEVRIENNSALLEGLVQTQQQRQMLLNALLESGTESIADNLEVLERDFSSGGGDAKVEALSRLMVKVGPDNAAKVTANLDEDVLNYQIVATNSESARLIEDAADIVIVGLQVSGETSMMNSGGAVEVMATSDGSVLTLTGQVFSDEQHRRLTFAAKEAMGSASQVIDGLSVSQQHAAMVGTDERIEKLALVLARFTPSVTGEVQMQGSLLTVNANVASEAEKSGLQAVMASARSNGITVEERIFIVENGAADAVSSLQQSLDELAFDVQRDVVFNSGTATLSDDARYTLDRVASVIKLYPGLQVEVEGHTDNVGRDLVNEKISRERALAVKNYLISRAVEAGRLVAVGYGHRIPVASNDTPEGRKKNRRVHFNAVKQALTTQE